jgi:choline dehydrogenase-like flavoprotein
VVRIICCRVEFRAHSLVIAGPAGCATAARLAQTPAKPRVLLLEAGSPNGIEKYLEASERFNVAFDPSSFDNWGYKTEPQNQLDGQQVDYSRGRGLGGTTSINFCGWLVGPRDDYEQWARLTNDDDFRWANVKQCLDRIQNVHPEIPVPALRKYLKASPEQSTTGLVDLCYGESWLPDIENIYVAAEQVGMKVNADINDGDPIGLGMGTVNCWNGKRIHAAIAYLPGCGPNLTVVTGGLASKIIVEKGRAVAVNTLDGRRLTAQKEIILSGGALNSPQLLLLSGIGPKTELEKHNIPVVLDLPMVGQNLRDHCYSAVGIVLKHGPDFEEATVPPLTPSPMAFLKSPSAMSSAEFATLPSEVQHHLSLPTVPNFEIATVSISHCARGFYH